MDSNQGLKDAYPFVSVSRYAASPRIIALKVVFSIVSCGTVVTAQPNIAALIFSCYREEILIGAH